MKIYISLPISNRNIQCCRERAAKAKRMVERRGHEAVTPFEICSDANMTYAQCIGRDIEALLGCDGIFLLTGWSCSAGCQIEWRAAQTYKLKIYQHIDQIPYATSREQHSDSMRALV